MISAVRTSWLTLMLMGCSFTPPSAVVDATPMPDEAADSPTDVPQVTDRVTSGLIGLWVFDENGSPPDRINDRSNISPPVSPQITNVPLVTWSTDALTVTGAAEINTGFSGPPSPPNRLIEACRATNAVTLEVWVTPANVSQTGTITGQPARVISLSPFNAGNHEISIGQMAGMWTGQVRTSNVGVDVHGSPMLQSPVVGAQAHLVVTSDGTNRRFYVNGELVEDALGGSLASWDRYHSLVLAGDPNNKNTWLGTFHLAAMYSRALDASEVMQNLRAGPL